MSAPRIDSSLTTFEDWTLRVHTPSAPASRLVLMLHGWTGDETSMWPFARALGSDAWLLAPRAPYPAIESGYSWQPVSRRGFPTVEALRPAAAMLADLLERWTLANALAFSTADVIGFSQGAAVAIALGLFYPQRVRRLAVLAGFAPPGAERLADGRPLSGCAAFVAHGTLDETVPLAQAHAAAALLAAAGARVTTCEAAVGHKVGAECLRALGQFFAD